MHIINLAGVQIEFTLKCKAHLMCKRMIFGNRPLKLETINCVMNWAYSKTNIEQ